MSSFTSPLIVLIEQGERRGRGLATLAQKFSYDVGSLGSGVTVTVPIGFTTDFGSVPCWARFLISNFDRSAKACVLHDYLWENPGVRTRSEINAIFREALGVLNLPPWRAYLMWLAVSLRSV